MPTYNVRDRPSHTRTTPNDQSEHLEPVLKVSVVVDSGQEHSVLITVDIDADRCLFKKKFCKTFVFETLIVSINLITKTCLTLCVDHACIFNVHLVPYFRILEIFQEPLNQFLSPYVVLEVKFKKVFSDAKI